MRFLRGCAHDGKGALQAFNDAVVLVLRSHKGPTSREIIEAERNNNKKSRGNLEQFLRYVAEVIFENRKKSFV